MRLGGRVLDKTGRGPGSTQFTAPNPESKEAARLRRLRNDNKATQLSIDLFLKYIYIYNL